MVVRDGNFEWCLGSLGCLYLVTDEFSEYGTKQEIKHNAYGCFFDSKPGGENRR